MECNRTTPPVDPLLAVADEFIPGYALHGFIRAGKPGCICLLPTGQLIKLDKTGERTQIVDIVTCCNQ